jgi:hypothetical protein
MAFNQLAKSLLSSAAPNLNPVNVNSEIPIERNQKIAELEAAGWSRAELLEEYRKVYDSTQEDSIKKQILSDISKIHGMMSEDEKQKVMPTIVLNIVGDNARVNAMLCPAFTLEPGV